MTSHFLPDLTTPAEQEMLIALGYDVGPNGSKAQDAMNQFLKSVPPEKLKAASPGDVLTQAYDDQKRMLLEMGYSIDKDNDGKASLDEVKAATTACVTLAGPMAPAGSPSNVIVATAYNQAVADVTHYSSADVQFTVAGAHRTRMMSDANGENFDYNMRMQAYGSNMACDEGPVVASNAQQNSNCSSRFLVQDRSIGDSLIIASNRLGLNETKTKKELTEYLSTHGGVGKWDPVGKKNAWCAVFVNSVLGECGIKGTKNAGATSFRKYGDAVKNDEVMPGDIAIFKRYDKAGKLVGGHVAFVVDRYKDAKGDYQVIILGGNQSNSVSVASRPEKDLIEYRRVPPEDAKKLAAAVGAYEEKIKTDPHLQKIAENKIQVVEKARMSKKVEAAVL